MSLSPQPTDERRRVRVAGHGDPRMRVPPHVVVRIARSRRRVRDGDERRVVPGEHRIRHGPARKERRQRQRAREPFPLTGSRRETSGRDRREDADDEHDARRVGQLEREHQEHAAESRAEQIDRIQAAGAALKRRKHESDGDPARNERHRDDHVAQRKKEDASRRRVSDERDPQIDEKPEDEGDRVRERRARKSRLDVRAFGKRS